MVKYQMSARRLSNVFFFSNAEECMYRLRKQRPDFLITEYDTGFYLGQELLRMSKTISPGTLVIFFTSSEDRGLADMLLESGASDYIVKSAPLDKSISELIRNIGFLRTETLARRE